MISIKRTAKAFGVRVLVCQTQLQAFKEFVVGPIWMESDDDLLAISGASIYSVVRESIHKLVNFGLSQNSSQVSQTSVLRYKFYPMLLERSNFSQ